MTITEPIYGVLAVNKPSGCTSRDVVNDLQRLIRPIKVGHTGTLDPLASGVLLLVIGKATRLVEFSHLAEKAYEAEFVLGLSSDTLDVEGVVTRVENAPEIDRAAWQRELLNWTGSIRQTPPKYSACQVAGKRAYDLARKGIAFELESRQVFIHELQLIQWKYPYTTVCIRCSSGTYVRTLGDDIARALGSTAVLQRLVRTAIGQFKLSDCVSLEHLQSYDDVRLHLHSPLKLVDHLPRFQATESEIKRLKNGLTTEIDLVRIEPSPKPVGAKDNVSTDVALFSDNDLIAIVGENAALVAIAKLDLHRLALRPIRVLLQ